MLLPILSVPMEAWAASVDIGIASMTANPANSVTLPSSGYASVTITVYFHNSASFAVQVAFVLDYRGFNIAAYSQLICPSGLSIAPGDSSQDFLWVPDQSEAGTFGTAPYQINAALSVGCGNTDTNASNNQYSIPYYVYPPPSASPTITAGVASGSGSVTVNGANCASGCSEAVGSSISVQATASSGFSFYGGSWSISGASCSGGSSSNPCTFSMPNNAVTINANFLPAWKSTLIAEITTIKGNLQGELDDDAGYLVLTLNNYESLTNWGATYWNWAQAITWGAGFAASITDVGQASLALKNGIVASGALTSQAANTVLQAVGTEGQGEIMFVVGYVYDQQVKDGISTTQGSADRQVFFQAASSLLTSVQSGTSIDTNTIKTWTNDAFRYSTASNQLIITLNNLQSYITTYPSSGSNPPATLDINYLNGVLNQINGQVTAVRQHLRVNVVFPWTSTFQHHTVDFPDMYRENLAVVSDIANWRADQAGNMVMTWGGIAEGAALPVLVAVGIVTAPAGVGVAILGSLAFTIGGLLFQMHSDNSIGNAVAALESQYGNLLASEYSVVTAMQQVNSLVQNTLSNLPTLTPSGSLLSVVRKPGLFSETITATVANSGLVTDGFMIVNVQSQDATKPIQVVNLGFQLQQGQTLAEDMRLQLDWLSTIFGSTYTVNVEYYLGALEVGALSSQIKLGGFSSFAYFTMSTSGWKQIPGATLSSIGSGYGSSAYLVVRGTDNGIYFYNNGTGLWLNLPGGTADSPAALVLNGKLHVVVRGTDNGIYYGNIDLSSLSWSGWSSLAGGTLSPPALVSTGGGVYAVVRGTDNGIYIDYLPLSTGSWTGWIKIPGATSDTPAVAVVGTDLQFVVRGTDNGLYYTSVDMNTNSPMPWVKIPGATSSAPSLVSSGPDRMDLIVRGTDNGIYHMVWNSASGWTGTWEALGGSTIDRPSAVFSFGKLVLAVRGSDNGVYIDILDVASGTWSGWNCTSGGTPSYPNIDVGVSALLLCVRGSDNGIYWLSL
jgi:hypothetical protein